MPFLRIFCNPFIFLFCNVALCLSVFATEELMKFLYLFFFLELLISCLKYCTSKKFLFLSTFLCHDKNNNDCRDILYEMRFTHCNEGADRIEVFYITIPTRI